jgi:hypothetical protein
VQEQIEADDERRFGAVFSTHPLEVDCCNWSVVPSTFLPAAAEGRHRYFVVQTCCWLQYKDFYAHWSPPDGRPILAFESLSQARGYAEQDQARHGRLGLVEVETDDLPCGELFLTKDAGPSPLRSADARDGKIVTAFSNRLEAEQDALERDRDAWRRVCESPDRFRWNEWTTLPPELIGDLFLDLGVPAPPSEAEQGYQALWDWWKQTAPLTDGWQRERLRLALDRFSRYRVVAVPVAD